MIYKHVKDAAGFLNESKYIVELPDNISNENECFADNDGLDSTWLNKYWSKVFKIKLSNVEAKMGINTKLLDACCGRGFLGEYLLKKHNIEVDFCDLSDKQLDDLSKRLNGCSGFKCSISKQDITSTTFPDNYFNYVIGNSFLHHLQHVPNALLELKRILKDDGSLILLHEPGTSATFYECFPVSLFRNTAKGIGFTDLWQFDSGELKSILIESGFRKIQIVGSGILHALILNWYFILLAKLRINSKIAFLPALYLRAALIRIEFAIFKKINPKHFPSLCIVATK